MSEIELVRKQLCSAIALLGRVSESFDTLLKAEDGIGADWSDSVSRLNSEVNNALLSASWKDELSKHEMKLIEWMITEDNVYHACQTGDCPHDSTEQCKVKLLEDFNSTNK